MEILDVVLTAPSPLYTSAEFQLVFSVEGAFGPFTYPFENYSLTERKLLFLYKEEVNTMARQAMRRTRAAVYPANVKSAYIMINGAQVQATYDSETELWTAVATAPAVSSWEQPDHKFQIEIYAEDLAGNIATMDSSDPTYGDQLALRVLEKTPPTATVNYPTTGSVIGSNSLDIRLFMADQGGSGINMSEVYFMFNGTDRAADLSWTHSDAGYSAVFSVAGLNDGTNHIEFGATDNDGNDSVLSSVDFVISTKAPSLNITSPGEGVITNADSITVSGTTFAGMSPVFIQSLTVNGEPIQISADGSFTYEYPLTEGENVITILATDSAGNSTQIIRNVTFDSRAPIITDVTTDPIVVESSGMVKVTFKVTDPA